MAYYAKLVTKLLTIVEFGEIYSHYNVRIANNLLFLQGMEGIKGQF